MTKISQDVLQQAADWYAILLDEQATLQQQQAHQQWLQQDEQHELAWQQIQQISQQFSELAHTDIQQKQLITHTLTRQASISRRQLMSIALVGGFGGSVAYIERQRIYQGIMRLNADASTAFAQQKQLVLTTGLQVWLNTQSAIQYRDGWLKLLMGEMVVQVAQDVVVHILHQSYEIIAQHAKLCIRQFEEHSVIGVLSGSLRLKTGSGLMVELKANQQVSVFNQHVSPLQPLQSFQWSWMQGVLAVDSMYLAQWASEMQRYYSCSIDCSAQAAQLRVIGVFPLQDFGKALWMLGQALPIQVKQRFGYWVHIDVV